MGVIIFICLSGTFPFDEDEIVVEETLKNLFFDEDNLWKTISIDGKLKIFVKLKKFNAL